jgi:uncharacterized OB-fold protein
MSHERASWRLKEQRYKLVGERCPHCSQAIFPPRDICPDCGLDAKEPKQLSGKGRVYSFTTVTEAPVGFEDQAPYTVALIELDEGPLVSAQLTDIDPDKIEIGMPVEMVTRKLRQNGDKGVIIYGYKFRPPVKPAVQKRAA